MTLQEKQNRIDEIFEKLSSEGREGSSIPVGDFRNGETTHQVVADIVEKFRDKGLSETGMTFRGEPLSYLASSEEFPNGRWVLSLIVA